MEFNIGDYVLCSRSKYKLKWIYLIIDIDKRRTYPYLGKIIYSSNIYFNKDETLWFNNLNHNVHKEKITKDKVLKSVI